MEPEYVMIESVRDAQPDVEDGTTISSPGMESLDAAADAASTALRHAEAEGARGFDNSGNIFSLLNLSAKKPYSAALLMELVLFLHCEGCSIAPNHIPREYNTWADELTHPDFEGFSLDRRLPAPETLFIFPFATKLLSSTGFS